MKIYYYHTRPIQEALNEWENHKHPGHILYGLPLFNKLGIECFLHRYQKISNRLMDAIYNAKEILCCKENYDVLYATSFRGIEIIVFLRALGLYNKPIAVWHHTAVTTSSKFWREKLSRLFYKGFDHLFFFSQKLLNDSLKTNKVTKEKVEVIHWGPDLEFYDYLLTSMPNLRREGFISTGKENRDISTLLHAFSTLNSDFNLYICEKWNHINYREIIEQRELQPNIQVHFTDGIIPYELAKIVAQKHCVVICCLKYPYTIGLTTLVEALALGIPVICSRNPYFEIDIDKEQIGITVDYNDVEGWKNAIRFISEHPKEAKQMGNNARKLAEERFNLEIFSEEIAKSLMKLKKIS